MLTRECPPKNCLEDREAELQTLRLQKEEVLAQVAKKDAVQADSGKIWKDLAS